MCSEIPKRANACMSAATIPGKRRMKSEPSTESEPARSTTTRRSKSFHTRSMTNRPTIRTTTPPWVRRSKKPISTPTFRCTSASFRRRNATRCLRRTSPAKTNPSRSKSRPMYAAFHSLGRAGSDNYSTSVIRANIIKIAKRKGFTLPKSAQSDASASESAQPATKDLVLVESADTLETIVLKEARADYPIKLIAPGKGASAYYPKEVLQRDGPKVFKAGTHIY